MGAISKHKEQLVGKYFFFRFADCINVIGKIERVIHDGKTSVAFYSPACTSDSRRWFHNHFDCGSVVDNQCIVFSKSGSLVEFFKLFFYFGGFHAERKNK